MVQYFENFLFPLGLSLVMIMNITYICCKGIFNLVLIILFYILFMQQPRGLKLWRIFDTKKIYEWTLWYWKRRSIFLRIILGRNFTNTYYVLTCCNVIKQSAVAMSSINLLYFAKLNSFVICICLRKHADAVLMFLQQKRSYSDATTEGSLNILFLCFNYKQL